MRIYWNESFSVGIESLDEQHRNFFNLANKILDIIENNPVSYEEALKACSDFGDYSLYHFSTEEEYFEQCDYENTGSHFEAHNTYRKQVSSLFEKIRQEKDKSQEYAKKLAEFAASWLASHILIMDKKYSKPLIKCGVK